MEWIDRVIDSARRAGNNNRVISVLLLGSFMALVARSASQQKHIQSLQSEKDSLRTTNKAMKKTLWDWKQQLYAEASESDSPVVPLPRLKSIYGEASPPPSPSSPPGHEDVGKSSQSKFVV